MIAEGDRGQLDAAATEENEVFVGAEVQRFEGAFDQQFFQRRAAAEIQRGKSCAEKVQFFQRGVVRQIQFGNVAELGIEQLQQGVAADVEGDDAVRVPAPERFQVREKREAGIILHGRTAVPDVDLGHVGALFCAEAAAAVEIDQGEDVIPEAFVRENAFVDQDIAAGFSGSAFRLVRVVPMPGKSGRTAAQLGLVELDVALEALRDDPAVVFRLVGGLSVAGEPRSVDHGMIAGQLIRI